MADPRGRQAVALPAGAKHYLFTGNSMLLNYSKATNYAPTHVYETDPSDGQSYKSDGDGIVAFDHGWWSWSPDGISRRSVLPYWLQLAVGAGKCPAANILQMAQGGTDCVDWQPGGWLWQRMLNSLAMLAGKGITPAQHVHYLGCWEATKNYSFDGVRGITNWFIVAQQAALPGVPLKLGMRGYIASATPEAMAAVRAGMYQAVLDQNNPLVSVGPDDDAMAKGEPYDADGVHFGEVGRGMTGPNWTAHL